MPSGRLSVRLMTTAISIPVAMASRFVIDRIWIAAHPDNPPRLLTDRDVKWSDAIAYAALRAAGFATTEILTREIVAVGYRRVTGNEPPPPKPTRAQKREQKRLAQDIGDTALAAVDGSVDAPSPPA